MYQLITDTKIGTDPVCIKRIADNAFIPMDEANTDYQEFLKWCAEGNQPEPADE
jgi:hypothetical protein